MTGLEDTEFGPSHVEAITRIQYFASKQVTRYEIKMTIKDYLLDDKTELPEGFDPEEVEERAGAAFAHLSNSARSGARAAQ